MGILSQVNLQLQLDEAAYRKASARYRRALGELGGQLYRGKRPLVVVFEGLPAAGKSGAIKRLTSALDPRAYAVHSGRAPTGDDLLRHYLTQFWRLLPQGGEIAILDGSWYRRVLYDRVESVASPGEWRRAYREINQFERQLDDFGTVLVKLWMHVGEEEQTRRLEEHRASPERAWRITEFDWQAHRRRNDYIVAADEMFVKTSTLTAPWVIVEGDDRYWARVKVLRTVVERLSDALGTTPPSLKPRRRLRKLFSVEGGEETPVPIASPELSEEDTPAGG